MILESILGVIFGCCSELPQGGWETYFEGCVIVAVAKPCHTGCGKVSLDSPKTTKNLKKMLVLGCHGGCGKPLPQWLWQAPATVAVAKL